MEVDEVDPAFKNPTKPIGSFYTKEEAMKLSKMTGAIYKEDAGRGYRRVIASPMPRKICELLTIKKLIEEHSIVITCGGGGIPVVYQDSGYKGIDAVIDKDRTSALLASKVDADILLILTAIKEVKIHFNTKDEEGIKKMNVKEAKEYINNGEFAPGSMLPKIEACIYYLLHTKNTKAIIASLEDAKEAICGKCGTTIIKEA